jgi:hypothetical protein
VCGWVRKYWEYIVLKQENIILVCTVASFFHIVKALSLPGSKFLYSLGTKKSLLLANKPWMLRLFYLLITGKVEFSWSVFECTRDVIIRRGQIRTVRRMLQHPTVQLSDSSATLREGKRCVWGASFVFQCELVAYFSTRSTDAYSVTKVTFLTTRFLPQAAFTWPLTKPEFL